MQTIKCTTTECKTTTLTCMYCRGDRIVKTSLTCPRFNIFNNFLGTTNLLFIECPVCNGKGSYTVPSDTLDSWLDEWANKRWDNVFIPLSKKIKENNGCDTIKGQLLSLKEIKEFLR